MELIELTSAYDQRKTCHLNPDEKRLIAIIQKGIPLASRPYEAIATKLSLTESCVIEMIKKLIDEGHIKRFGVVVRHHEVGYLANAMIVWDIADDQLETVPFQMKEFPFVTLCYRRPRVLPDWPYNLFCMIHGRDRAEVLKNLKQMIKTNGWQNIPHEVLFSKRRFKQRGACYQPESLSRSRAANG